MAFSMAFCIKKGRIMNHKVIVGLGNPGLKYKYTRHNVGFMFIDSLSKDFNLNFQLDKKLKCLKAEVPFETINGVIQLIFVKPVTYMNNSGESVENVLKYYNADVNDLIVIHDDLDLPVAKVRIRTHGSSGGQKGMQSIIDHLKTNEIKRIRIGIDKSENTIDYVLSKFSKDEKDKMIAVFNKASNMIKDYLSMSFENFMNEYNKNE